MVLNFGSLGLFITLITFAPLKAFSNDKDANFYTIEDRELHEVKQDYFSNEIYDDLDHRYKFMSQQNPQNPEIPVDPIENPGNVIKVARDLVALGEEVYKLVVKGRPANVTSYSPMSVIPKVNGEAVDLLETENWKAPKKKTYEVNYRNLYGISVVTFRYSIIYSYNGSYSGKGAYLTSVQIVPEFVNTLFGFNFSATMKLGGIQNQGTRENPIAGATLLIEYVVSSILVANNSVDSFFISGNGGFQRL